LKEKLGHNAVALQMPMGLEIKFEGVIDLIKMKALYFDGSNGETVREEEIPSQYLEEANAKRDTMLDAISIFSDELTEALLEEKEITQAMIIEAVRKGTLTRELTPVMIGSAYKNKGVQPLLDGVNAFLPCPSDVENEALDTEENEKTVILSTDMKKPLVSFAFKLEDGQYGQLTYIRVYQGAINKGDTVINVRTGKKVKIGRLVRLHANHSEEIEMIPSGYIGAMFGIDCASGDSFCILMASFEISLAIIVFNASLLVLTAKDSKNVSSNSIISFK
jgi:elongation factor G